MMRADNVNKKWESRLITLTPGSRRRLGVVRKKLAALLPWRDKTKRDLGAKIQPLAPGETVACSGTPLMTEWRSAPVTRSHRAFQVIRNPAAGTLMKERRLTRAALRIVKSASPKGTWGGC